MAEEKKLKKKIFVGTVVSDKMDKTIVVKVSRSFVHPHVSKVVKMDKKYKVHDESSSASKGDVVEFYEGRPVSKTKYMYLSRILESTSVAS